MKNKATIERKSDREMEIRRTFDAPARIVFEAWTKPDLFIRWWVPKSFGMKVHSCEMDIRTGGGYRIVMSRGGGDPMAFYGKYVEVTPHSRLVWTNEESGEIQTTTVTFEEKDGKTHLVFHELHPSKEALDGAVASSVGEGMYESFDQLDEILSAIQ